MLAATGVAAPAAAGRTAARENLKAQGSADTRARNAARARNKEDHAQRPAVLTERVGAFLLKLGSKYAGRLDSAAFVATRET
jgi:hypothetical protein